MLRPEVPEAGEGGAVQSCYPEDHDWVFDGYFWHVCDTCGAVS